MFLTLLLILNFQINNQEITFLTPQFVDSKIYCSNQEIVETIDEEMGILLEHSDKRTGHSFHIPDVVYENGWYNCVAVAWGEGYVFPSERDIVLKRFEIYPSGILYQA